jgi:hypothetical protein
MADLRAPDQNRLLGVLADLLRGREQTQAQIGSTGMGALMDLILPSSRTVEKLSYGDPLFRMPTQSNIPITADREYLTEVVGMAPAVAPVARATTKLSNKAADELVRMITQNPEATAPAALEAAGQMVPLARVISRDVATQIKMPVTLPQSDDFVNAVQNTPGAEITNEGLVMRLQRMQKPEQAGEESVRSGVFYLPEGSASMKYYKSGGGNYGGLQSISGETLYKNPLFVKGATGGKAPEKAYDLILGKGAYEQMRNDALKVRHPELISDKRYGLSDAITPEQFLAKYAPDLEGYGDYIFKSSRQGNQLAYALQEAAVAQKVRDAGYDAVLGFSQKKTGDKFISEVFDVREATYPTPEGGFTLRPEFAGLLNE